MQKRILFLLLFIIPVVVYPQQFNRSGNPIIANYTPEIYGGNEQTWCIAQDNRGVMYFGSNDNGVLEYDGSIWKSFPLAGNKSVSSLLKGEDGIIYVGSISEFGYLEPQNNGNLKYKSLILLVPDSIRKSLGYIYKIHWLNGKVYFCSSSYIFEYNGSKITPHFLGEQSTNANFLALQANGNFYINSYLKGLRKFSKGELELIKNGQEFEKKNVYSIVSIDANTLLIFSNAGFYIYKLDSGVLSPIDTPNRLVKKMTAETAIPYSAIKLSNKDIALGLVASKWLSILEFTSNLIPVSIANTQTGLHSAQITDVFQYKDAPLWATHYDGGISKVEINSNIRRFAAESGINESISDIIRFRGVLYIATLNGVYYLSYDENGIPAFEQVKGITGNVWSLIEFKTSDSNSLLLAGNYVDGVYQIINGTAFNISTPLIKSLNKSKIVDPQCYILYQSQYNRKRLYMGMTTGLAYMDWDNGHWVNIDNKLRDSINFEIRSIKEDRKGNLWLATTASGVFCIKAKGSISRYNKSKIENLDNLQFITLYSKNDSLYLLTSKGIYHFDYFEDFFKKGGLIGDKANLQGIYRLAEISEGYAALCYNTDLNNSSWVENFVRDTNNHWKSENRSFKRIPARWADAIYADKDGVEWFGISKELYGYDPSVKRSYNAPFCALVRKVVAKDSSLFDGTYYNIDSSGRRITSLIQQEFQTPRLSYHYNAMFFNYAAPYFEKEEDITFSHYLEGSDEEGWSHWEKKPEATYTNLREGKYIFHVKAKNIYGDESVEAIYAFEIRPPWYRSILAYVLYVIFFILFVWGIVKWNTRRLIAEKERLEQIVKERTAEVVAQKEEIEDQKEQISAQNEEITSSIQYASRIQTALLTPNEQINQMFPDNFILFLPRDIVSGDFYFFAQVGSKKLAVAADCTGHGVPGGFMSMLGVSFLTQIISEDKTLNAGEILNKLRSLVIKALHQTSEIGGSKDGMDIALYLFDEEKMTVEFAGANNPLIVIRDDEIIQVKGDKMPIGIHLKGEIPFTNNVVEVQKNDVLYTFSDGYADQFGGENGRKFMIKNLKELFLQIHTKPMDEQREILDTTLKNWHGDSPRIDDVVVIGVRIV